MGVTKTRIRNDGWLRTSGREDRVSNFHVSDPTTQAHISGFFTAVKRTHSLLSS